VVVVVLFSIAAQENGIALVSLESYSAAFLAACTPPKK
jgi:hypothetical protein